MIDQVDEQLRAWIDSVLGAVPVSLGAPRDTSETEVSAYLMDLVPAPPVRGDKPALQIGLRYLVTVSNPKPEEAHRLLGKLVFTALAHSQFEVDREPLTPAFWSALGVTPRPAFVLRAVAKHEQPQVSTPLVRKSLAMRATPIAGLHGIVLGPDDVSIANARVEIPALHLSTRSDARGRFHFGTLPAGLDHTTVWVRAKGREVSVDAAAAIAKAEPLIIRLFGPET